jgi:hypothetical protein
VIEGADSDELSFQLNLLYCTYSVASRGLVLLDFLARR